MERNAVFADALQVASGGGSQTLLRGLAMLDAVGGETVRLADLSLRMGLSRSTTHRLANALVDTGFLTFRSRDGYRLGPKLMQLGFLAQAQADLVQVARPHLEALAAACEDTVHLGRREGDVALYLDKLPGRRRIEISSRIGDRHPLTSTGLGKALMLDDPHTGWRGQFDADRVRGAPPADFDRWTAQMQGYVAAGHAFDLEENEDAIRCVAAPVRDAAGRIAGAISVSSAAQYMDDARMAALADTVRDAAQAIGRDLGWNPEKERG
ncbi:IclR family transcriptional regulator [uncultured Sphingomonas sp.]|uniref:IclR family transcriptional regulator n=1 Tax=uncultured Sphingomonas sp. TaxID=158754 RepID=UPI0025E250C8|nr:IclR family transcriptional regulator [uncultured Sphingomonas sp.]